MEILITCSLSSKCITAVSLYRYASHICQVIFPRAVRPRAMCEIDTSWGKKNSGYWNCRKRNRDTKRTFVLEFSVMTSLLVDGSCRQSDPTTYPVRRKDEPKRKKLTEKK